MSSGASPEFVALVEQQRAMLRRLLAEHAEFIDGLTTHEPGLIEREAAAVVLHSFYTGVEFTLRAIADRFDGGVGDAAD